MGHAIAITTHLSILLTCIEPGCFITPPILTCPLFKLRFEQLRYRLSSSANFPNPRGLRSWEFRRQSQMLGLGSSHPKPILDHS